VQIGGSTEEVSTGNELSAENAPTDINPNNNSGSASDPASRNDGVTLMTRPRWLIMRLGGLIKRLQLML
jgi:hypothetical protein